jgi:D-3-phosphoglycerate dehydrogenase
MAKILVTDGMASEGLEILKSGGHTVDNRKVAADELLRIIKDYDGLVVRSATQVTDKVVKAAQQQLKVVGRPGGGDDNLDQTPPTNARNKINNAPQGNNLSAPQHTKGKI